MAKTISFDIRYVVDTSLDGNDFLDALADYMKSVQVINNFFRIGTMNDRDGKYSFYMLPKSNLTSGTDVFNVALSIRQSSNWYINGAGGHGTVVTNYNIVLVKERINLTFYFSDYGDCVIVARDINNANTVLNVVFAETENGKTEGLTIKKSNSHICYSYSQNSTGSITRNNSLSGYSVKYLIRVSTSFDIFKRIYFAVNNIADTSPYEIDGKKYVEFDVENAKIGVAMLYE